jgi:hypothetical protein
MPGRFEGGKRLLDEIRMEDLAYNVKRARDSFNSSRIARIAQHYQGQNFDPSRNTMINSASFMIHRLKIAQI